MNSEQLAKSVSGQSEGAIVKPDESVRVAQLVLNRCRAALIRRARSAGLAQIACHRLRNEAAR